MRVVRSAQQRAAVFPRPSPTSTRAGRPTRLARYSRGGRDSIHRTPTSSSVSAASPFARTRWPRRGGRPTRCSRAFRPTPTRCCWPDSWRSGRAGRRTHGRISSVRSSAAPDYVDVHIALGRVEAGAGRRAEARRHFERALELDPSRRAEIAVWLERVAANSLMRIVWSRAIASVFWFATAVYCLLSAIPFASEQFLKPGLVPALVTFAGWHAWISLAALAACAAALAPWLRSGHRARARVHRRLGAGRPGAVLRAAVVAARAVGDRAGARAAVARAAGVDRLDGAAAVPLRAAPERRRRRHRVADFAACVLAALVVTLTHALSALPSVFPLGLAQRAPRSPAEPAAAPRRLLRHLRRDLRRPRTLAADLGARRRRGVARASRPRDRTGALPLARRAPAARARGRARGARGRRVRRGAGGGVRSARDPGAAGSRPGAERPRSAVVDAIARRRDRLARGGGHRGLADRTAGGTIGLELRGRQERRVGVVADRAGRGAAHARRFGRHAPESSPLRCASSCWV